MTGKAGVPILNLVQPAPDLLECDNFTVKYAQNIWFFMLFICQIVFCIAGICHKSEKYG